MDLGNFCYHRIYKADLALSRGIEGFLVENSIETLIMLEIKKATYLHYKVLQVEFNIGDPACAEKFLPAICVVK